MNVINTGIVGFGTSGKVFHAPFLNSLPSFNLYKISTGNPHTAAYIHEKYPSVSVADTAREIIEDSSIDLVIIATSNDAHFPLAKEALLNDKHVVVEKPFTLTTHEADELIGLAEERGKMLTVYQNRRWDSDFKTVKKILESGILGNLVEYTSCFDRYRPEVKKNTWREENSAGAGILYDLGPHLIDQALQLFGLPAELYATILTQRKDAKTDDYLYIHLFYPSGLIVNLHAGMLVKSPTPRFALYGDKGSFVKYGLDIQEEELKQGKPPSFQPDWGKEPEKIWGTLNYDMDGMTVEGKIQSENGNYAGFYTNLYKAIQNQKKPEVLPAQARNVIRIIELARESNHKKRTITL